MEYERETVLMQARQVRVVGPRSGENETIGVTTLRQLHIPVLRFVEFDGAEKDVVTIASTGPGDALKEAG
jgi:hypothetical protein